MRSSLLRRHPLAGEACRKQQSNPHGARWGVVTRVIPSHLFKCPFGLEFECAYEPLLAQPRRDIAVAYAASIDRFLDVLRERVCAKVDALALEKRRVPMGCCRSGSNCTASEAKIFSTRLSRPWAESPVCSTATCSGDHEPGSAWCYRR